MIKQFFLQLLTGGLLIYGGVGLLLYLFQETIIYFPLPQDFEKCPGFADAQKIATHGTRLYTKELPQAKRRVVFYHGNGGATCDRAFLAPLFEKSGASYIFVEYTGYSSDGNRPSMQALLKNVEAVIQYLGTLSPKELMVVGESIGAGPAAYHASLSPVDKILLIASFPSLRELVRKAFPIYPSVLASRNDFQPEKWLRSYTGPLLIIHGDRDDVVPFSLGEKLYKSLSSPQKSFVPIKGATHNDIYDWQETLQAIVNFIADGSDE